MARPLKAAPALAVAVTALSLGACGHNPIGYSTLSERECMARVMYFESNRSSEDGMLAVGTVVMNRVQSPRYPKSVCAVVGQRSQFADGALSKPVSGRSYALALKVADAVLSGERHDGVGAAMFFHTAGYTFPYRNMAYVVAAGGNVFYEKRTPGTFDPIHPATLVAQASPLGARSTARVQVASARDEDDDEAPSPRRTRTQSMSRAVEADAPPPRRPVPVRVAARDEDEEDAPPVPRRAAAAAVQRFDLSPRPETKPVVISALASPRREAGPPTIAELIDLDLERPRRR